MKACLVVLLRRHLETSRIAGTAPALFQDARLSRAITAILNRPAADHSLTSLAKEAGMSRSAFAREFRAALDLTPMRSEEHTSELQSLMRISYAVFCLQKKTQQPT